uniref:Uncharacterized protein n=1 Tax=Triticum urartu TaxID=4572 RepID=A0A8R7QAQ7_TRIUA
MDRGRHPPRATSSTTRGHGGHVRVEMHARLLVLVADSTVHAVMGDQCRECGVFLRELDWSIGVALRPRISSMDCASRPQAGRVRPKCSGVTECINCSSARIILGAERLMFFTPRFVPKK